MIFDKMLEMSKRIYENKMLEKTDEKGNVVLSDSEAIKALVDKTFSSGGEVRDMEQLRVFNKLIVETAEKLAEPRIQPILNMISDYATVGRYDTVVYEVPKKARISMALTATAAGVDFKRISPSQKKQPAKPETHQFGVYYNIDRMISDPVNEFRNAVNYVAEYKVKYIFTKIMALVTKAKTAGGIPTGQVIETANIDLMDYRDVENRLMRYGRGAKPVMVADRNLIDSLAMKQATLNLGATGKEGILLTDELRKELLTSAEVSQVSRTTAIATDNPFVDDANSKVDLPVNEGIVLAGGNKSPFMIREFGGMRVAQGVPDIEDERVNMKIDMKLDITLLLGQAMAYLKDTAVTLG
jgi:hypothetical protein